MDNPDNNLSVLSLEGYQGVISYGFVTPSGNEYSATAPLVVKAQELLNISGRLVCQFDLFGIPDQLAGDKALTAYTQDSSDTKTIEDLFDAIAGATLAPFSHTTAITVNWDSRDSLVDTFQPKDFFKVNVGESRLDKLRELLSWTKCVMRIESDGEIHIQNPTITGTNYDYEYNDDFAASSHPFFSKVLRTRLVLPNKFIVKSTPAAAPYYEGSATSAASFALLAQTEPKELGLISDAQATAIAEALIQRAELAHERGSLYAPMNVGAEVHDFVNVTDNLEGDSRKGNTGYLTRIYDNGKFDFLFGFGDILLGSRIGTGGLVGGIGGDDDRANNLVMSQNINILDSRLADFAKSLDIVISNQKILTENQKVLWNKTVGYFDSLTVTDDLTIPTEPA